jgi:hypothetical protein
LAGPDPERLCRECDDLVVALQSRWSWLSV